MPREGISFFKPQLVLDFEFPALISEIILVERGQGPFSDAIELSMYEAISVIAKLVVDETPVNLGHLSAAISQSKDISYGKNAWYGEVSDGGIAYAPPVEYGIEPFKGGKGPSRKMVDNLTLWIVRKQIQWYRKRKKGGDVKMTSEQMAWALAWHIARHGTEGAHMFEKGVKAAIPHVNKIWENLLDELTKKWGEVQL